MVIRCKKCAYEVSSGSIASLDSFVGPCMNGHDFPNDDASAAVFIKPTCSASTIANNYREKYDVYSKVCQNGTFVPNARLRKTLDYNPDHESVLLFQHEMQNLLLFVDTFRSIPGGSEKHVVDGNLQRLLTLIAKFCRKKQISSQKMEISQDTIQLANSTSPEHCLCFFDGSSSAPQAVLVSEVKPVQDSIRQCYPQFIAVSGDSAIGMNRGGLSREDSVVPGIVMAGSCVQFCAVYLLEDNFPVMVAMSPEISPFGSDKDQQFIAEWCLRFANLVDETADMLLHSKRESPVNESANLRLTMDNYFAKPVRNVHKSQEYESSNNPKLMSSKFMRMNRLMEVYERLRLSCKDDNNNIISVEKVILFPVGVVSVPGSDVYESLPIRKMLIEVCEKENFSIDLTHCPLILYPRLFDKDGWRNDKPPDELCQFYKEQLTIAIKALNTAKIAHLDLRPANIMWRRIDNSTSDNSINIETQLIDFEDVVFFDHPIPEELISSIIRNSDYRYPFKRGDEKCKQFAKQYHNEFFLESVNAWLDSETKDFGDFMSSRGQEILRVVIENFNNNNLAVDSKRKREAKD